MKQRILLTVNFYLPGHLAGGPIRSISHLVDSLGDEFEMLVITSDRDFKAPDPYADVQLDAWNRVGKAHVYYMRQCSQTVRGIARLLRETPHDLLYLNSFFSPRFSIIPLMLMQLGLIPKRPVLIAPRGEFSTAAYRLKSWKKRPFTGISRIMSLHRGVRWHASTDQEADDIRRTLGVPDAKISVARNLVGARRAVTGSARNARPKDAPLRVCFLSRIARMKNLDFALRVLAQVKTPVLFSIYGPKDDIDYWCECERLIGRLPAHVRASYEGSVPYDEVCEIIAGHELFFVPSRGENFGHVFFEALSAGVPVLTSDQTPWRDLQGHGTGWDLPLQSLGRFVAVFDEVTGWSPEQRADSHRRCLAFADDHVRDDGTVQANRRLFEQALGLAAEERG